LVETSNYQSHLEVLSLSIHPRPLDLPKWFILLERSVFDMIN